MRLRFRFGAPETALDCDGEQITLALGNAVLSGPGEEVWELPAMTAAGTDAFGIQTWHGPAFSCAAVIARVTPVSLREITRTLYARLLDVMEGRNLYRIWNFVPGINTPFGELDVYKLFCLGRAEAFEQRLDTPMHATLPAASALGTPGNALCIVVFGGGEPVQPVENPLQVPAWRYPVRYGPRAPSFARASLVGTDRKRLYVSGTASIRQSESLHEGDPAAQLALACDNIDLVFEAAGLADWRERRPEIRLYARNAQDWPIIRPLAEARLQAHSGVFNVVVADICRPELLVEVEAFLAER